MSQSATGDKCRAVQNFLSSFHGIDPCSFHCFLQEEMSVIPPVTMHGLLNHGRALHRQSFRQWTENWKTKFCKRQILFNSPSGKKNVFHVMTLVARGFRHVGMKCGTFYKTVHFMLKLPRRNIFLCPQTCIKIFLEEGSGEQAKMYQ